MQSGKKPYNRIISTILIICMLVGILPQTVISLDSFSNDDTGELLNQLLEENVSLDENIPAEEDVLFEEYIPLEENITLNSVRQTRVTLRYTKSHMCMKSLQRTD